MNKQQLVDAVGERLGDRKAAATAVEAVLETVSRALADGEKVSIFGFGVFEKVDRAARTARNPATGATVQVPATSVPRFRPGQALKDAVNGRSASGRAASARAAAPDEAEVQVEAPTGKAGKAGKGVKKDTGKKDTGKKRKGEDAPKGKARKGGK